MPRRAASRAKTRKPILYGIRPAPKVVDSATYGMGLDAKKWVEEGIWVSVISSNVSSIMYDKAWSALMVRFNSGKVYRYNSVAPSDAEDMFNATSMGSFVWQRLRGAYPAVEVTGM